MACAAAVGLFLLWPFPAPAAARPDRVFRVSIDPDLWARWGFQYPVTCVFEVPDLPPGLEVRRRDAPDGRWRTIRRESATNFFNGVECVRLDGARNRALVSVGFAGTNFIDLAFGGAPTVRFAGIARYYDDRAAAYTLSIDNWGRQAGANPGASWRGADDDRSDNYQAALRVCRGFHLPVSIAINTAMAGGDAMWAALQAELDVGDFSWEPAVHARTHPGSAAAYEVRGRCAEVIGCRDDLLARLHGIPYGPRIFEHILTSGYQDDRLLATDAGEFLLVRAYNGRDNPESTAYGAWDTSRRFYGPACLSTVDYDRVFARRDPKGRFFAEDAAVLDAAFDRVCAAGGIVHAMWHPDRYRNSVLHDARRGVDGAQGSTLIAHLAHVAHRRDVWYVANGWMYLYRFVAENAEVVGLPPAGKEAKSP